MKILYAVQGTGNGHITRAEHFLPHFAKYGKVDTLISASAYQINNSINFNYKLHGLGFTFGNKGGIDYLATYKKNKIRHFWNEVKGLEVEKYDLVISDFEPISAWACYKKNVPCIGLSNQVALLNKDIPKPITEDIAGLMVLKHYAPFTKGIGFHYQSNGETIFNPIVRESVRNLTPNTSGPNVVYLPSYKDEIIVNTIMELADKQEWKIFSKRVLTPKIINNKIIIYPINGKSFLKALAEAKGVVSAAGFSTTSEALYLGKKLLVVPQKHQFEQQCNAMALKKMGVVVSKSFKKKRLPKINNWLLSDSSVKVQFQDQTPAVLNAIFNN